MTLSDQSMTFTGPAELLEHPSPDEIRERIEQTTWRTAFDQAFAESQHRLGYIETRFQLDYLCSEPGIATNLISFGLQHGVTVRSNRRPRWKPVHSRR